MTDHLIIRTRHPTAQRGVAVLIALVVLVAMSLAAVALMRSVDTASLIAGNLAFRQGATIGGDIGVEAARTALLGIADLGSNASGSGYYATVPAATAIDLTGNRLSSKSLWVSWPGTPGTGQAPFCLPTDTTTGNAVCYIIHRLCTNTGDIDPATCFTYISSAGGGDDSDRTPHTGKRQGGAAESTPQGYYRITVRTAGPRNNVSFLQAFVVI